MTDLKSVEDHNRDRLERFQQTQRWCPSGLACPDCGAELLRDTTTMLTSYPPQVQVQCLECDHKGAVLA